MKADTDLTARRAQRLCAWFPIWRWATHVVEQDRVSSTGQRDGATGEWTREWACIELVWKHSMRLDS